MGGEFLTSEHEISLPCVLPSLLVIRDSIVKPKMGEGA